MKVIHSPSVSLCQLIVLLALSIAVYGQDLSTARILVIEGKVDVRRRLDGKTPALPTAVPVSILIKPQDLLFPEDIIITGRNGRLVLALADGSQIIIAPKSTVKVENLTDSPRNLINVIKGKTRIQIEKLGGRPNPYRVNTPTTVIAVRGTIFDVLVDDDRTDVYLHEGEVTVSNRRFPDRPLQLSAGSFTRIQPQALPRPPVEFGEGRNDRNFRIRSGSAGPSSSPGSGAPRREGRPGIDQRQPQSPPTRPGGIGGGAGGGNIHLPSPSGPRSRPGGRP